MLLSDKAYRVDAHKLVEAISSTLEKEKVELPVHGDLIKTGCGRQYSPYEKNWFYTRMASIVRQAMCKDRVSMTGLAHKYGVRKNRGVKPTKLSIAFPITYLLPLVNLVGFTPLFFLTPYLCASPVMLTLSLHIACLTMDAILV
ncbi:hypothetical protein EHP00_2220 [Ecytonucleospora hepatopenaei]|uniref:Uncharacterized protein n=1 Tax=Ecytonucleospora hepatopenaei TaxID=646526 RepID=A0A1W0E4Z1_9MICR|nr:hypothetical protein EHP00_2220 [Ecytonucleospora hepatopenaei]